MANWPTVEFLSYSIRIAKQVSCQPPVYPATAHFLLSGRRPKEIPLAVFANHVYCFGPNGDQKHKLSAGGWKASGHFQRELRDEWTNRRRTVLTKGGASTTSIADRSYIDWKPSIQPASRMFRVRPIAVEHARSLERDCSKWCKHNHRPYSEDAHGFFWQRVVPGAFGVAAVRLCRASKRDSLRLRPSDRINPL
jgi:hypothetical protein